MLAGLRSSPGDCHYEYPGPRSPCKLLFKSCWLYLLIVEKLFGGCVHYELHFALAV